MTRPLALLVLAILPACGGGERCDNREDDDGDGFVDCRDQDCSAECGERCGNLLDDDGDGAVDALDPECGGLGTGGGPEACDNGADDDGDWLADCDDPDCRPVCDNDADGWLGLAVGGDDCDDGNAAVHPEADEVPYDGLDQDCDPTTPDDDVDGDGFLAAEDCDDANGWAFPGAPETCGDGVVDDCGSALVPPRATCYGERPVATADAELLGPSNDDWAGATVVSAGDVNGDGYADLAIGAYGHGEAATGMVFLVNGPVTGTVDLAQATANWTGESIDDWAGFALAAGELTGPGRRDLAIGARYDDDAGNNAGAVYVVRTNATGNVELSNDTAAKIVAETQYDSCGFSLAASADIDGDEVPDLVMGCPLHSPPTGVSAGAVYVVPGPILATTQLSVATYKLVGEDDNDNAGCSVGAPGDLNGDGRADVLVGACLSDRGGANAGTAYQFSTPTGGELLLSSADGAMVGEREQDQAGWAVGGGDLDDDGLADVVVGAPFHDMTGEDAGAVYVALGPATAGMNAPDAKITGEAAGDKAGSSVASIGDLDGDGYADLAIGAPGSDAGGEDAGAAYVLWGPIRAGSSLADAPIRVVGALPFDFAGQSVSGAGDVDADGFPDLLVGAPFHDALAPGGGAAYLFTFDL